MMADSISLNKKNSKDLYKKLPPHLRYKYKNNKTTSPLKNQVDVKDDKSSISSANVNNFSKDENTNPNIINDQEKPVIEDKNQNQKVTNDSLLNSDYKKLHSLNNTNYDLLNSGKSNTSNEHYSKHENHMENDDAFNEIRNNIRAIISRTTARTTLDISFKNDNIKETTDANTLKNKYINSSENAKHITKPHKPHKPHKKVVVGPKRTNSLPRSMALLNSSQPSNDDYLNRPATLSRITGRGGSDNKIKQILGADAVNSLERNSAQQLSDNIVKNGNMDKIQQILIDGGIKNKNRDITHSTTNNNNTSLSPTKKTKNSVKIVTPTHEARDSDDMISPKHDYTLNDIDMKEANITLTNINLKHNNDNNNLDDNGNKNINEERNKGNKEAPTSILLNGNIERSSNKNKSVSILEKNGTISSINDIGSPRNKNSLGSPHLDNNLGSPHLDNSMASYHLDNSIGSPRFNNSFSFGSPLPYRKKRVSSLSNENFYANNSILRSKSFNTPTDNVAPITASFQQGSRSFSNDESSSSKHSSAIGHVDRDSKNDIFSFGAKKKQEEKLKKEKENSLKVSKESLIFSGYIEKLSSRHKFQKRILRFDGVFLTCLSQKKKQKLPTNTTFTTVNPPCFAENSEEAKVYLDSIKRLYSTLSPGPEFSSPLLAIDDSKNKNANGNPNLKARHFYLPKWIINVKNIIEVRPLIHPDYHKLVNPHDIYKKVEPEYHQYISGDIEKDKKTFIIKTRERVVYVIRTYTEKECNVWLFILTRTNEILKELVYPPNEENPSPHNSIQNVSMNTSGIMNNNKNYSPKKHSRGSEDNNIRRFMSRDNESDKRQSQIERRRSRQYHNNVASTKNIELLSLYTNNSPSDVHPIKTPLTDLIDRKLPKDPLHLHYIIFEHWKNILEQLNLVDNKISASVVRAENSELISIMQDSSGNDEIAEENRKNPHIWIPSPSNIDMSNLISPREEFVRNPGIDDTMISNYNDKTLVNINPNIPPSNTEIISQMYPLKPSPTTELPKTPGESDINNTKKIEPSPASSSSLNNIKNNNPISLNSVSDKIQEKDNFSGALKDLTVHRQIYTVDTIEQPQPLTYVKTKKNQPIIQKRSSVYSPTIKESTNIPASDPTLQLSIIQSIPWDEDLSYTVMGLLRIFHRLSGIPFVEGGENEHNTPPVPIPHWYYEFCVKSIPVHIIQIQNILIDYLQELEYRKDKLDEEDHTQPLELRQLNKSILTERYNIIEETLGCFIKLSNIWDEIISQWQSEMIREKITEKAIPISESDLDNYLSENVEVSDVINVHSKIKEYIGKEMLVACRCILKLFEK